MRNKVSRTFWTAEQITVLSERYPHVKSEVIAQEIGRSVRSVYQKALALGLKKSPEFLQSGLAGRLDGVRGGKTRFQKGHRTWNAGMKGWQAQGVQATQFKPGSMPHDTQPIGSYRLDKDGTLQRKISNAKGNNSKRWRGVHELVWVEANGPVPAGHIVVFKPGMRTNILEEITLQRVECISFAENMQRNTRHRLPKEINEVIHLRAVLSRQINKRSKHEQKND